MTGFNIVVLIAIILCARLGVRLYVKWNELKHDTSEKENDASEETTEEQS